jgi:tripartite-type tricarboxylate transporter receptor subunit TctC
LKIFFVTLAVAMCTAVAPAHAQQYPAKLVRIVVPFPPGGSTDVLARDVARQLAPKLGANVIVENRPGASGIVGTEVVAKAAPDGATLLFMATHHVINPSLYKNLPYDPRKNFTNIGLHNMMPVVLVAGPKSEAKSVRDLVALAKKNPGKLFFASGAIGGANHLSGELFNFMTGTKIEHVPYKGTAPALADLLGGQIPLMYDVVGSLITHIRSGELRALAVTSTERLPSLPNVPTMDETVAKGYDATAWFGLYAPAGLPPATESLLENAFSQVQRSQETAQLLAKFDALPGKLVGQAFTKFVNSELDKWHMVIERAGVKVH